MNLVGASLARGEGIIAGVRLLDVMVDDSSGDESSDGMDEDLGVLGIENESIKENVSESALRRLTSSADE